MPTPAPLSSCCLLPAPSLLTSSYTISTCSFLNLFSALYSRVLHLLLLFHFLHVHPCLFLSSHHLLRSFSDRVILCLFALDFYKQTLLYTNNNSVDYTFCPVCITKLADISMMTVIMCCVHLRIWPNFSTLECATACSESRKWCIKKYNAFGKNRNCSDDRSIDLRKIQNEKTVMVQNQTGLQTSIQSQSSLIILALQNMNLNTFNIQYV